MEVIKEKNVKVQLGKIRVMEVMREKDVMKEKDVMEYIIDGVDEGQGGDADGAEDSDPARDFLASLIKSNQYFQKSFSKNKNKNKV